MRPRSRLVATLLSSISMSLIACGLGVTGSTPAADGGGPGPVATGTGPGPGSTDASAGSDVNLVPDSPAPPCSGLLADGWVAVFTGDADAKCPEGFPERDLLGAIDPSSGCDCNCLTSTSDPPSCSRGTSTTTYGSSSCITPGVTFNVNGTGCTSIGQTISTRDSARFTTLPFSPGSCSVSVVKNDAKVITTPVRECAAPSDRAEEVCSGAADAATVRSCVAHDGDVPCPGAPFVQRTLAATGFNLTCSGCSTCTNTGSCSTATIRYFANSNCSPGQERGSHLVDGQCHPNGSGGDDATHYRWDVTMMGVTCMPTTPATASVARTGPRTICCR